MQYQASEAIVMIKSQYIFWSKSKEPKKEIECEIKGTDLKTLKVTFSRGGWIYPIANNPKCNLVPNRISLSSDNEKIKNLFERAVFKSHRDDSLRYFCSDKDKNNDFELRFFPDEISMKNQLIVDENYYASYNYPRYGVIYSCTLS